jgi:hypothetical protein
VNFRERPNIMLSACGIAFQQVGGDPYAHDTAHLAGIGLGLVVLDICW